MLSSPRKAIQNNPDLLLRAVLLAGLAFDVFDDPLAGRLFTRSHLNLRETYDERKPSLSTDLNLRHKR